MEAIPGVRRRAPETSHQRTLEPQGYTQSFVVLSSGDRIHKGSILRKQEDTQLEKQVSLSHGTLGHLPIELLDRLLFVTFFRFRKNNMYPSLDEPPMHPYFLGYPSIQLGFFLKFFKRNFSPLQELPNTPRGLFLILPLGYVLIWDNVI